MNNVIPSPIKSIKFNAQYATLIQKKQKTQTIRLWKKCKYQINDRIILDCKKMQFQAVITDIQKKLFSDLSLEDAIYDGFKSQEELRSALKKIYTFYQNITDSTPFYIIQYQIL